MTDQPNLPGSPTNESNAPLDPTPENSIPPGSSPSSEDAAPAGEGDAAEGDAPTEPTADELRAAIYADATEYKVNLPDDARQALGIEDGDPMVTALASFAAKNGKPQGWVDDALEAASALQAEGLFDAPFDPAAEAAALGENAGARRREAEVFAQALKDRGEFDDGLFGEFMSLTPTANGVRLIEFFRKGMGPAGEISPPTGGAVDPVDAAKDKAREMAADARYGQDRAFTAEADRAWKAAWPGSR